MSFLILLAVYTLYHLVINKVYIWIEAYIHKEKGYIIKHGFSVIIIELGNKQ